MGDAGGRRFFYEESIESSQLRNLLDLSFSFFEVSFFGGFDFNKNRDPLMRGVSVTSFRSPN